MDIDFFQIAIGLVVLLVSLTVHEAAHAWSADRLGDATARRLGRVSFNPAVHIDPVGTIAFPLIAMATNLPLIGWAKPVPVNTQQLGPAWKQKFMAISAAGPASNLALAIVGALVLQVVTGIGADPAIGDYPVSGILRLFVSLNVFLAVFNMVPLPPLDGGNVLSGLLSGPASQLFDSVRPYGFLILYALMFTGTLWSLISPPASLLLSVLL
ncbi:MAG: site-2 protease family protein [Vicinamibacterales bacterium]